MAGEDEHWQIVPNEGVGALRLGASRTSVDALRDIYGAIVSEGADRIPDTILEETLAQFGEQLSEEEKQSLLATYAQDGPDASSVTEVRGTHGLVLRFVEDRLIEILLSPDHENAALGGTDIFQRPAREVLLEAEKQNGAPGLYADTTAVFPSLNVIFEGFTVAGKDAPKELDASDDRFRARTVAVSEKIGLPMEDFQSFTWGE